MTKKNSCFHIESGQVYKMSKFARLPGRISVFLGFTLGSLKKRHKPSHFMDVEELGKKIVTQNNPCARVGHTQLYLQLQILNHHWIPIGAPQEEIPIRSLHVWHRNSVDDWCRCVELGNVWSNAKTKTSGSIKV